MMMCIHTSWDFDNTQIKSVALYSTGSGIKAEFLVPRVREITMALCLYGFIINHVCVDGATENLITYKQLADMTV